MGVPDPIGDVQPFAELARRPDTVVYKAYQRSLDRVVLLKVLDAAENQGELLKRFAESTRLVARIQHANVVAIHDYGEVDGQAYVVAEFVDGTDLAELLRRGRLPVQVALYIVDQVAAGLQAAHERGVVHRDVKPENILISNDGTVKLTDFGFASFQGDVRAAAEVRGTLGYLSPEQIAGRPADARSDLFALGATFFEMLTARRAFPGSEAGAVMDAVLHLDPIPVLRRSTRLPDPVRELSARMLAKDPGDRFQSAAELRGAIRVLSGSYPIGDASDLHRHLNGELTHDSETDPVESETVAPAESNETPVAPRPGRIRPAILFLAAVGAALALVAALSLFSGKVEEHDNGDRASGAPSLETPPQTGLSDLESSEPQDSPTDDLPDAIAPPNLAESGPDMDRGTSEEEVPIESGDEPQATPSVTAESAPEVEGASTQEDVTLRIEIAPWANVSVDGVRLGSGPLVETRLRPGRHELLLEHPSFPPIRREVEVREGEALSLALVLDRLVGRVRIRADHWGNVEVDGSPRGTLPQPAPFLIAPGRRHISVHNPILNRSRDTTLVVEAERDYLIHFTLSE